MTDPTDSGVADVTVTARNNVTFFPNFEGPPSFPPEGSLGMIQHTIGGSRFLQLSLHLLF